MGIVIYFLDNYVLPAVFSNTVVEIGKTKQLLWVMIEFITGACVYMLSAYLMKADQARDLFAMGKTKIKSIFGK
jgi:hypothetical protein